MLLGNSNPFPIWPPIPGLLDSAFSNLDFSRKNEWSADDWRSYATFLEIKGSELIIQLCDAKLELIEAKKKASRQKYTPERKIKGLITVLNDPTAKRGRPKSEDLQSMKYAWLVLQKKAELETQGNRSTYEQALEAVCEDLNLSRMQRQLVMSRMKTIFNKIPKLRRS